MSFRGGLLVAVLVAVGAGTPARAAPESPPDSWPREVRVEGATLRVYQPQIDAFTGNRLEFRAAVGVEETEPKRETFGVIWGAARADVDRVARLVALEDFTLTRSNFPGVADNGAEYLRELRAKLPMAARTISLDRIEASLAASGAAAPAGLKVKNDPPRILVSYVPAVLIPIDGKPVVRRVPDHALERILNTRALILREPGKDRWYLRIYDGWVSATSLEGSWEVPAAIPAGSNELANELGGLGQVDLLDGGKAQPRPSLEGGPPIIHVSEVPAELVVFKGQPELVPIDGTGLLWCQNTTSDVIVEEASGAYYVLISGRWYRAGALEGPWSYVASTALPGSFRTIPPRSQAGVVLSSVAGTQEAREAVIANSVPHTASVPLSNGPALSATYDGEPKFAPIEGTPLQYALNSPTPILRIDAHTYYALRAGVWFAATSPNGPWTIALSVPAVVYTIPPSSTLHYVTYVQVYGYTREVVYVGYTPGYLGTVVASDGVVVYGTGYAYEPWVGNVYYAPPVTYGIAAQPVYNPAVGWGYGYGMGLATAAVVDSWGSPYYYSSAYHGYPCCGSVSANVYGHYGSVQTAGTRTRYVTSSGTVGETATGGYTNMRTGTTGSYGANRSYNPYTGEGARGYSRTFDTAAGTTGSATHEETYNAATGGKAYSGSESATGAGGTEVSHQTSAYTAPGQAPSVSGSTSVTSGKTGETTTHESGTGANNHYAGADGNVYKSSGDGGWQQHTSSGWQQSSGDHSSANAEQGARSQGESRSSAFSQGGWGSHGGGGSGGGGWGSHFGGGGSGDRFGEGGGSHGGGGGRR